MQSAHCAPGAKSQCPRAPFCQPQPCVHLTGQASVYLDSLQLGDGRPKRCPLLSIIHGTVQGCLRYSQSLGGDADPACVQSLLSKTKYALNQVVTDQMVHTDTRTQTHACALISSTFRDDPEQLSLAKVFRENARFSLNLQVQNGRLEHGEMKKKKQQTKTIPAHTMLQHHPSTRELPHWVYENSAVIHQAL